MAQADESRRGIPSVMRTIFGIIMIIVYVGMGVLLLLNYFQWSPGLMQVLRWVGGVVFILYGIWRAIRQFRGYDTPV